MKSKTLSLICMLGNIALIALSLLGLILGMTDVTNFFLDDIRMLHNLSAILMVVASIIMLVFYIISFAKKEIKVPNWAFAIKFIAVSLAVISFIVSLCLVGTTWQEMTSGDQIILRFIAPLVALVLFIIFEVEPDVKFIHTIFPFLSVLLYGVIIIILIAFNVIAPTNVDGKKGVPYFFFRIIPDWVKYGGDWVANIIYCIVILVGSYIISVILWVINRIMSSLVVGEEYIDEDIKAANKKFENVAPDQLPEVELPSDTNKEVAPAAAVPTSSAPVTSETNNPSETKTTVIETVEYTGVGGPKWDRVYHISVADKRKGTWKVKAANAKRALIILPTQAECIAYAKEIVQRSGGSIRVHSRLGKIRKDWAAHSARYEDENVDKY